MLVLFNKGSKILVFFVAITTALLILSCSQEEAGREEPTDEEYIEENEEIMDKEKQEAISEEEKDQEEIEAEVIEGYDEHITIIISDIDISDEFSLNISEDIGPNTIRLPEEEPSTPIEGNVFLNVYYTIARAEDRLIKFFDDISLYDNEENHYEQIYFVIEIVPIDPTDIRGGEYISEGANGFALFEIPEGAIPKMLTFSYSYFAYSASEDLYIEEVDDRGQIEIMLD